MAQASNNMFSVLAQDESDEEKPAPPRQTKHQQRAADKELRDTYESHAKKDDDRKGDKKFKEGPAPEKKGYSGEGKRNFDRHSGDGKNAHNKYEKKGGTGGKGNWGTENTKIDEDPQLEKDDSKKEVVPEEPAEPVLTLDDYMKENNFQLETKLQDEKPQESKVTTAEKGFKVLEKKEPDYVQAETGKNKDQDKMAKVGVSNVQGAEPQDAPRRGGKGGQGGQKGGKKNHKLGDEDFPTLS